MVGDHFVYFVLNQDDMRSRKNRWNAGNTHDMYIHPYTLILYEEQTGEDPHSVIVEYDVYPHRAYRPAFNSRRAFRNFQLTRSLRENITLHMNVFCQSANIWISSEVT